MSTYTNQIGQLGPLEGVGGTPKNNNTGIVPAIISLLGTVLGAVLPNRQTTIQTPTPSPTPIPQQSGMGGSTTILIAVVALVLLLKK